MTVRHRPLIFVWAGVAACAATAAAASPSVSEMLDRAKEGPSLLFTRETLPQIRERAKKDASAKKVLRRLTKKVDAEISEAEKSGALAVPNRGGQWTLWMNCKKCGNYLKSKSATVHRCVKCGAEYSGWPYDDCYLSHVHSDLSKRIRHCGVLWALTGARRYADHAKAILLAYADQYGHYAWHGRNGPVEGPKKGGARVFAQILDEAVWLIPILDGYDAIRETLTADECARIESGLIRASAETIMTENARWSNHEVWHLAAYGMAGVVLRDAKLLEKSLNGKYGALNQLEHGILADGIWYEGSLHYHFYTINAFLPYFRTLAHLGFDVPEKFKAMFVSPIGQLMPDGSCPLINDSWGMRLRPGDFAESYELAAAWWREPVLQWWVTRKPRKTLEYLLWGGAAHSGTAADACSATPKIESRIYEALGLAVLRSRTDGVTDTVPDNCVMLDFGPHGEWHGHPDKLNLMMYLHGKCVAEDPGCIGYGNSMHWGWYKSTLAHNTLRVDNLNQGPSTGELLAVCTNGNVSAMAVSASGSRAKRDRWDGPAYAGVDILRITALCGDVVLDYLAADSDAEHDYEWCFHSRGEMDFPNAIPVTDLPPRYQMKKYESRNLSGDESWGWVSDVLEKPAGRNWSVTWKSQDYTFNLWQSASAGGTLRTGKGAAQPASEKITLAVNRVRGKTARFASVFCVGDGHEVTFDSDCAATRTRGFGVRVDGVHYDVRLPSDRKLSVNISKR